MKRLFWLAPLFLVFLNSCVTNKKYTYLQRDDIGSSNVTLDSTLRVYHTIQKEYKIQPNDLVSVRFESLTPDEYDFFSAGQNQQNRLGNLSQGNALLLGELVDNNGEIPFPVIGKVKVGGLTVFEIQEKLQTIANEYLESPIVKVRLLNYRFTILGEVNSEGTINIGNNRITTIEAIGLAGGLTDLADKNKIKLIRQVNGEAKIQYINLLDESFFESPYYYLQQNDILIVPPLKQRPYRKYFSQNLSLVISSLSLLLLVLNLTLDLNN